jgi:hypothetical protein
MFDLFKLLFGKKVAVVVNFTLLHDPFSLAGIPSQAS